MIPAAVTTTAARTPATAETTAITRDFAATMRDLRRVRSRLSVIAPVRNSTPVNHAARTTRTAAAASIPRTLVDSTSSAVAAESAVPRVAGKVSTSTTAVAAAAAIVVISSCRDRGRSRSFAHSAAGIFDAMVVIAVPLPSCASTAIRLPGRLPGGPPSRLPNGLPGGFPGRLPGGCRSGAGRDRQRHEDVFEVAFLRGEFGELDAEADAESEDLARFARDDRRASAGLIDLDRCPFFPQVVEERAQIRSLHSDACRGFLPQLFQREIGDDLTVADDDDV